MYKYSLNFHFRIEIFCFILFVVMMILTMFGNVVRAGNKQERERCKVTKECAAGLICKKLSYHPTLVSYCTIS